MHAKLKDTIVRSFSAPTDVPARLRAELRRWLNATEKAMGDRKLSVRDRVAIRQHVRSGTRWLREMKTAIASGDASRSAWCAVAVCDLLAKLSDSYHLIPKYNQLVDVEIKQHRQRVRGNAKTQTKLQAKKEQRRQAILRSHQRITSRYNRGTVGSKYIYFQIEQDLKDTTTPAKERTIRAVINAEKKSAAKR